MGEWCVRCGQIGGKKEKDVEDELANQFNDTMNISTKRRRVDDV